MSRHAKVQPQEPTATTGQRRPPPRQSKQRHPLRGLVFSIGVLCLLLVLAGSAWLQSSGRWPFNPVIGPPPAISTAHEGLGKPVLFIGEASALAVLETLPVKGRASTTGYQRANFGVAWLDADTNGCDTRNDILRRDLTNINYELGQQCKISEGQLQDPYTGRQINFKRGAKTSDAVQIDHVVALSNAWQTGAQQLTKVQKQSFANDPLNLLSVDGAVNQDKSAADAATWLPPNKRFRCQYVARQISIKAAYSLWVTPPEKEAMKRILALCPNEQVRTSGYVP